jgi:hypothetical protein
MRSIFACATALRLWGGAVAEPADPTQRSWPRQGPTYWATRIAVAWQMSASRTAKTAIRD